MEAEVALPVIAVAENQLLARREKAPWGAARMNPELTLPSERRPGAGLLMLLPAWEQGSGIWSIPVPRVKAG